MKGYLIDGSAMSQSDFVLLCSQFDSGLAIANPDPRVRQFKVYIEDFESLTDLFQIPSDCKVIQLAQH